MSTEAGPPDQIQGRSYGVPTRRREIVELLTEAYAQDQLEQIEFERRVERAEHSGTIEELDQLVADFPADFSAELVRRQEPLAVSPRVALSPVELQTEIDRLDGLEAPTRINILGDQHISVAPGDPRVVRSVSLIGDCEVDLRSLSGQSGVFLLKIAAAVGDTKIIVPQGTSVDIQLHHLVGDQKHIRLGDGRRKRLARRLGVDPNSRPALANREGPTVIVTGVRLVGDTEVIEA